MQPDALDALTGRACDGAKRMSRSGYWDDCEDELAIGRWRGAVASAIRGKRGQRLLKDLAEAMDEMPEKKLITQDLKNPIGYCTLGVICEKRKIASYDSWESDDTQSLADALDIAEPLVQEIVYLNDEYTEDETPEQRWVSMRAWVDRKLKIGEL